MTHSANHAWDDPPCQHSRLSGGPTKTEDGYFHYFCAECGDWKMELLDQTGKPTGRTRKSQSPQGIEGHAY